ncbi:ATP synthase F1 subunit gamma [Candidatus Peregrinibacteria bacterium]|nr:ATP synthase F1 subunit gamma [Candidatus Peregrinibacteria bacterium]
MARSLRDLRRKMKAIKSTRQVTKAMELVSASKMRRAVQNAQLLRRYALTAWAILQKLAAAHTGTHPWLQERPVKKVLAIIFTSDRGLCGSLNTQLFRALNQYVNGLKKINSFEKIDFIAIGRKGQQFLARTGQNVVAAFPALSNHPKFSDVLPMTRMALEGFRKGDYDHVVILYTDFISALAQEPGAKVLLPFSETELKKMIEGLSPDKRQTKEAQEAMKYEVPASEYVFEPSEEDVLDRILPQLTEMQVYQAVLESAASEHSARMVAMRSASDNASDILYDLTLSYNQTRQGNITAELAELSASKAALD